MDINTKKVESMADFEKELEASFKTISVGDIITATVIGTTDTEIILDLQYYTEGIIHLADYTDAPDFSIKNDITIGDEITAMVISTDDGQGNILLSKKESDQILSWELLEKYKEEETVLDVKITGIVNSGVIAYVEGIRGFIPASRLSLSYVENLEDWLFKSIQVRVITVEKASKKLVLSARELLREKTDEENRVKVSNVEIGLVTEGKVESLQPYGAFVNIGNGLSGLLHISQISQKKIKHPSALLAVNDTIKVKVIDIKDGKLSLSMKALEDVASQDVLEEEIELPQSESITTNLASLFANIKLD